MGEPSFSQSVSQHSVCLWESNMKTALPLKLKRPPNSHREKLIHMIAEADLSVCSPCRATSNTNSAKGKHFHQSSDISAPRTVTVIYNHPLGSHTVRPLHSRACQNRADFMCELENKHWGYFLPSCLWWWQLNPDRAQQSRQKCLQTQRRDTCGEWLLCHSGSQKREEMPLPQRRKKPNNL